MILILTSQYDYSTNCVIKWLNYYGKKFLRINGDDGAYKFYQLTSGGVYFKNIASGEIVNLSEAKACWWRRPGINQQTIAKKGPTGKLIFNGVDISPFLRGEKSIVSSESADLAEYICGRIYSDCPVNLGRPKYNLNKLQVMDIAKNAGLKTPDYQVITEPDHIGELNNTYPKTVSKAISNGVYNILGNQRYYSYTELIEKDFITPGCKTGFFPSLIMQLIEKRAEVRTFYIEGIFFSMLIRSQSTEQTSIDFRKYNSETPNRNEPFKLPVEIENKLTHIFSELDLNCGSADLIIDKEGDYIFLEINPVGQYSMVSEPCNYELDKLIANFLINGSTTTN